jgi:hypothetical protein
MNARMVLCWWAFVCGGISLARGQDAEEAKFVGTFSNGVSVELIGIGMHPSAQGDWWAPDGTPLAERPYSRISGNVSPGPGGVAREACWRWKNIGEADVQTSWGIEPAYSGAADFSGNMAGTPEESLDKCALSFSSAIETCTFRFTITTPASEWDTAIESQAGPSGSTGVSHPALGRIGAAFMRPHGDGPDTIVATIYQIPQREVRLAALDKNGDLHVAESSVSTGLADITLSEFRFRNVLPNDLKSWLLQTRIRKEETIEFHNVSLEPGEETKVQVVDNTSEVISKNVGDVAEKPGEHQSTSTMDRMGRPVHSDEAHARHKRQEELLIRLADIHGYKLARNELLKYVANVEFAERDELRRLQAQSMRAWMSRPEEPGERFEPCMLLFEQNAAGELRWTNSRNGIITLAEVLENVLALKPQQVECPSGLSMTYMPGDWILSWDPRQPHEWSDSEIAAFEKVLNDEKDLAVLVQWKTLERPALVVTGKYKAAPKIEQSMSPEVAMRADGTFEIPARRSDISAAVGTHEKILQAIGEVLMLPVIEEATLKPTKSDFVWSYTGTPITGSERLKPAIEERVLKSLSEQLGYEFRIEPREVKVLSIQPVAQ